MTRGKDIQDYILSGEYKEKETIWNMCKQSDSLVLTGGAIVRKGYATLIVGPGTDNMLEATSQFTEKVDGIIGNGRAILFDIGEKILYTVHSPSEVRKYFQEFHTKRHHKPRKKSKISGKVIIMNLEIGEWKDSSGRKHYEHITERETGKGIRINSPSKSRKKIRNFAKKACHVIGDISLSWKEKIPMSFDDIYEQMKQADMSYCTVVTPFYPCAPLRYEYFKYEGVGFLNPHEIILKKLLEEKII